MIYQEKGFFGRTAELLIGWSDVLLRAVYE